jgi:hypothetical protein
MAPVFVELFVFGTTAPEDPAGFAEEVDEPGSPPTVAVLVVGAGTV